jgi:hypothetical protein
MIAANPAHPSARVQRSEMMSKKQTTQQEQMAYLRRFQWTFTSDMYLNAHNALTVSGRRAV